MQTYSTFQPTGFDPRGLALDGQQDWLVVPVGQNRDSDELREFFNEHCRQYMPIDVSSFDCDRDQLAAFIRQQRSKQA